MTEPQIPRLEGEPARWYARFIEYVAQSPGNRSVLEVYRLEKARKGATSIPGSWRVAVDRFQWRERAQAFDDQQAREEINRFADLRRKESERRFHLMRRSRRALEKMLTKVTSLPIASWSDYWQGVRIMAALDKEEQQRPELKMTVEGDFSAFREGLRALSLVGGIGLGLPEEEAKDNEPADGE